MSRPTLENEEFEITPGMIEAGVDELRGFDDGYFDTLDEWVRRIYLAMVQAKVAGQVELDESSDRTDFPVK